MVTYFKRTIVLPKLFFSWRCHVTDNSSSICVHVHESAANGLSSKSSGFVKSYIRISRKNYSTTKGMLLNRILLQRFNCARVEKLHKCMLQECSYVHVHQENRLSLISFSMWIYEDRSIAQT